LYHQALAILERAAPGSPFHANCLYNLGLLAEEQGDLAKAKEYDERTLAIEEKLAGPEGTPSPAVADSLNNLGNVARKRSDFEKAREYYEQALAIRKK